MRNKLLFSSVLLAASVSLSAQKVQRSRFMPTKAHKLFPKKFMASLPNIWVPVSMVDFG